MAELTAEFLKDDFNVEHYARKLLEENASVAEQLSTLASSMSVLDRQLKDQISTHHEQLLSQATNIESLEDILNAMSQHIAALQSSVGRACEKVGDLYKKTEIRTLQLQRLHDTCTLLRNIIRVLQLSGRGSSYQKDLLKGSQALQELRDVCAECDLRGVKIVEKELAALPKLTNEMILLARNSLKQGLKSQHHTQIGASLQAFYNLKCLEAQLDTYSVEMFNEAKTILKNFGLLSATSSSAAVAQGTEDRSTPVGGGGTPGTASLPNLPASVVVRANFWNDINKLVEYLVTMATHMHVLNLVASKKRESATHRLFDELIGEEFYSSFWRKMAASLKQTFHNADVIVRQTLEGEYPRLLRSLSTVFVKLSQQENLCLDAQRDLRSSLQQLETAYLSKSLARLFDTVNLMFSSEQQQHTAPNRQEIDGVVQTIINELNAAKFDDILFEQTCKNISKTIKLFAVKSEQLLITDGEASQIIGNPSVGQKQNIDVVNSLNYLRSEMQRLVERDQFLSSYVQESMDNLLALMSAAINPLLLSIEDALSAIIATLHQENFSTESSDIEINNDRQQCSLYVRELQDFVTRIWRDYLSTFECRDFVFGESKSVAAKACRLFLIHVSLIRPLGESGKLRLATDFAQFELAVSPLCRRLTDMGPAYATFKAFRPLLFQTMDAIAANGQLGGVLPYSLVIQLIISMSPAELQSPHVTAGWSLSRYADWLDDHQNEFERLQFLKGTLEAYARVIQTEGKTTYVPTYPLLLDTLKRGFEANK